MSTRAIRRAISELKIEDEEPFLIIAWKDGRDIVSATVRLHVDMLTALRDICGDVLIRIDEMESRNYDPDARLAVGEELMYVGPEHINSDSQIYDVIAQIDESDEIGGRAAASHKVTWYAIAFGEGDDLTLFIRKRLEQVNGESRLIGLAGDALRPSSRPIMIFDRTIDLIVRPEGVVAFNERAFEGLIRSPKDIAEELESNVERVSADVPFADETVADLKSRGLKRPMLRKKLRSIAERGHLHGVTVNRIAEELERQGFDPDLFIEDDLLKFDMRHAMLFLRFLDEGTWLGAFSNTLYASDGKSPVTEGATE